MVSFTCDVCQDVVKKAKVDAHCVGRCRNAWIFTCVDCNKAFEGFAYREHQQCISEEQKYWGPFGRAHRAEERSESEQQFPSTALAATPEHASVAAENARVDAAHVTTTILQLDWESSIKDCLLRYGKNKTLHWKRLRDLVIEAVKKKYRKQQGKLSLEDNTYRAILEDCCLSKLHGSLGPLRLGKSLRDSIRGCADGGINDETRASTSVAQKSLTFAVKLAHSDRTQKRF